MQLTIIEPSLYEAYSLNKIFKISIFRLVSFEIIKGLKIELVKQTGIYLFAFKRGYLFSWDKR